MNFNNKVEEVCIVLEKEKNTSNIVFTNMTDISRKVKVETNPKEISYIISQLEGRGLIKTLKKNKRQTVLEIKEDLLCKKIEIPNIDDVKDLNKLKSLVSITPKRLLEYIQENVSDNIMVIDSKNLCEFFNCKYDKLKLVLDSLVRGKKIEYSFSFGVLNITLLEEKEVVKEIVKEDLNILSFNSNKENLMDEDLIFDEIGGALQEFFDSYNKLKEEVADLRKKLEISNISNNRLRRELDATELRCKQMVERNNRLYNDMVILRTGLN